MNWLYRCHAQPGMTVIINISAWPSHLYISLQGICKGSYGSTICWFPMKRKVLWKLSAAVSVLKWVECYTLSFQVGFRFEFKWIVYVALYFMGYFSFLYKLVEKNYYSLKFSVLSRPSHIIFLMLLIMTLCDIYKHPRRLQFLITYSKPNHLSLVQGQDAVCQLTTLESKSSDSFTDLFSIVINKPKEKKLSRKQWLNGFS